MSQTFTFKTESKRLLDLMIHSIYTNKEIFLRELVSNASDAIDKYHFLSLSNEEVETQEKYEITLQLDEKKRVITITDNGIGMTYDEINDSLGTIAKSGTLEFLEKMKQENKNDLQTIGQFGVGFYSAFMVAKKVEVDTKSPFSEKAYRFTSTGEDTYKIDEVNKDTVGTSIKLYIRDNDEDANYDRFLEEYHVKQLIKKYSDYVRYPIFLKTSKKDKEADLKPINSMVPVWKKPKNEIKEEELNEFYKQTYFDFNDPQEHILINVEGALTYTALLFIPSKVPHNIFSEKYEKGLALYTKNVFIMEKCKELLPDYLRFVRGLVDTSDLPLNISRETLQHNTKLNQIATNVEKKIVSRLEKMQKDEPDKYIEFFKNFGVHIKFGVYDMFGTKKDLLKNLLMYQTTSSETLQSLKEYVVNMKKDQEFIYYASGKSRQHVLSMPQMDAIKSKEYDVLVLTEDVDEFAISILEEFEGKKFKSINQGDLDVLDKEESTKIENLTKEKQEFLDKAKEILDGKVDKVVFSKRLKDSAVCLVSGDGVSFEMEKVIQQTGNDQNVKAEKILEINPKHDVFAILEDLYSKENPLFGVYLDILYNQGLLMEGFPLEDPTDFARKVNLLMKKSIN